MLTGQRGRGQSCRALCRSSPTSGLTSTRCCCQKSSEDRSGRSGRSSDESSDSSDESSDPSGRRSDSSDERSDSSDRRSDSSDVSSDSSDERRCSGPCRRFRHHQPCLCRCYRYRCGVLGRNCCPEYDRLCGLLPTTTDADDVTTSADDVTTAGLELTTSGVEGSGEPGDDLLFAFF